MTTETITTIELRPIPPPTSHTPRSPLAYTHHDTLPAPIPSSTSSQDNSTPALPTRLLLKSFKLALATLATFLTLVSGWWALDLAMYQASASFQQTCLQQMQTLNRTVGDACEEVVGSALERPRTWRSFFAKGPEVVKRAMEKINESLPSRGWRNLRKLEDGAIHDELGWHSGYTSLRDEPAEAIENEPDSTKSLLPREAKKPCHPPPKIGTFCTPGSCCFGPSKPRTGYLRWGMFTKPRPKLEDRKGLVVVDQDEFDVAQTYITKQGDAVVMYGGMPSHDWQESTTYENLSCERYGWANGEYTNSISTPGEQFGGCFEWTDHSDLDALVLLRAKMTSSLFEELEDSHSGYSPRSHSIWKVKQWAVEDTRVTETLAATFMVIVVVHQMVRRMVAC